MSESAAARVGLHGGQQKRRRTVASGRGARGRTLGLLALALPALVTLIAVPNAVAGVVHNTVGSVRATSYAIARPICKPPKWRHSSCFAMRLVHVTKGTPGARPFEAAAGASASGVEAGPRATVGPAGGLTPHDLQTAYGYNSAATTTGQTVAIVDAFNDPKINPDLQTFDTHYGLLTCSTSNGCLTVVNQTGGATLPPNDTTGWSPEESLDVETVHSACQTCKIILIEATTDSNANLDVAEDEAVTLGATEVSNSYGSPEGAATAADIAAYNHPGVMIAVATGDDGYFSFDLLGLGPDGIVNQPDEPASFNTVVAVGGTSLYLSQTAARQSETVWNDDGTQDIWETVIGLPLGATGGGCSTMIPAPSWQTGLSVWASTGCGTYRLDADVAADADPFTGFDIYDSFACGGSCTTGWQTVGGTSLATPLIASMFALAGGAQGVEYPAMTLYGHLGGSSLYDVTSGGDGFCGGEGASACTDPNTLGYGDLDCAYTASGAISVGDRACDALKGYDGPSGVGTPKGLGAFAPLAPTVSIKSPDSVLPGRTYKWSSAVRDPFPGGVIRSYRWNWGDGSAATVTSTGTASHEYASGSVTRTITLTVTDNYGRVGTTKFRVTVS